MASARPMPAEASGAHDARLTGEIFLGFTLFYLSRFLLSHGLAENLERTARPIILNVAGPGGTGDIRWNDLQLRHGYFGPGALGHGGRLNDLLGAGFADVHPGSKIRYILFHPGVVSTSFSGEYDAVVAA